MIFHSALHFVIFVYSKSSYTIESVSVSGRLHHNSLKRDLVVIKFCTQNCIINIPIEFEDETDWARPSCVIVNRLIISKLFDLSSSRMRF